MGEIETAIGAIHPGPRTRELRASLFGLLEILCRGAKVGIRDRAKIRHRRNRLVERVRAKTVERLDACCLLGVEHTCSLPEPRQLELSAQQI
jgi:hypothetical protein